MLKSQSPDDYSYRVIGTNELSKVRQEIKKAEAQKFSEALREIQ